MVVCFIYMIHFMHLRFEHNAAHGWIDHNTEHWTPLEEQASELTNFTYLLGTGASVTGLAGGALFLQDWSVSMWAFIIGAGVSLLMLFCNTLGNWCPAGYGCDWFGWHNMTFVVTTIAAAVVGVGGVSLLIEGTYHACKSTSNKDSDNEDFSISAPTIELKVPVAKPREIQPIPSGTSETGSDTGNQRIAAQKQSTAERLSHSEKRVEPTQTQPENPSIPENDAAEEEEYRTRRGRRYAITGDFNNMNLYRQESSI